MAELFWCISCMKDRNIKNLAIDMGTSKKCVECHEKIGIKKRKSTRKVNKSYVDYLAGIDK